MSKPVIYLTNKSLLVELNRAKATYCYFVDEAYAEWDAITDDIAKVDDDFLEAARKAKVKATKQPIDTVEGFIVRVMTDEHVPDEYKADYELRRKRGALRPPFPPFKHYRWKDGELIEVGRSHWRGGLTNGWFDPQVGRITDRLALMWSMLSKRYASRANFRNYSFREEMEMDGMLQLIRSGLYFDESRTLNPFAYWTQCLNNAFIRRIKIEATHGDIRDALLIESGQLPSLKRQSADEDARLGIKPLPRVKGKAGRPRKVVTST